MNLLTYSAYYVPEVASGMFLTTSLYEDLAKNGVHVKLFCPLPTRGVDDAVRNSYKSKKHEKQFDGNLEINRLNIPKEKKNPISRALRYIYMNFLFILKSFKCTADAIYVCSTPPTQGAMAAIIKKIKKIPFVFNLQDVFPDDMISMGMTSEDSIIAKIGRKIENFTYKNADKIIVISNDMKQNILDKGVPAEKIEVVSNWVDEALFRPIAEKENFIFDKFNISKDTFNVVYAGNLGNAQNISIIVEAANQLQSNSKIQFYVFGNGAQEDEYKQQATDLKLNNIHFYPMQPYEEATFVYSMGDVCVVPCKKGFGGSAMPSKTWSIMATGTPILASFDKETDMEKLIDQYKVGLFSEAGDLSGFTSNILELSANMLQVEQYGKNAREYIDLYVSRKKCTEKYEKIIRDVIL